LGSLMRIEQDRELLRGEFTTCFWEYQEVDC
jgi:hypothetical protein